MLTLSFWLFLTGFAAWHRALFLLLEIEICLGATFLFGRRLLVTGLRRKPATFLWCLLVVIFLSISRWLSNNTASPFARHILLNDVLLGEVDGDDGSVDFAFAIFNSSLTSRLAMIDESPRCSTCRVSALMHDTNSRDDYSFPWLLIHVWLASLSMWISVYIEPVIPRSALPGRWWPSIFNDLSIFISPLRRFVKFSQIFLRLFRFLTFQSFRCEFLGRFLLLCIYRLFDRLTDTVFADRRKYMSIQLVQDSRCSFEFPLPGFDFIFTYWVALADRLTGFARVEFHGFRLPRHSHFHGAYRFTTLSSPGDSAQTLSRGWLLSI